MPKPTIKSAQPQEFPEVIAFLEAYERLQEFKVANAAFYRQLEQLSSQYNDALENAEKAVRSKQVCCGPFDLYQFAVKYDSQRLYEELGREDFLKVGGKIETTTTYSVDKAALEMNISRNLVPQEVVEVVVKSTPNYHKPDKVVLP